MKSLLVIISLLLAIRCHGNTTDNCTTFPTFTNYIEYSPTYHCDIYGLPPVYYHQGMHMTVNVSSEDDNVTLIWYTHEDGVLVCDHMPCDEYVWSIDNKTLSWLNPNETKVFYVNATNSCGRGNATACFKVEPFCQQCNDCPQIPSPTNNSIKVAEHSDQTFDFTIKGEVYTVMKWCFAGSDHHNKVCCYCNAEPEECPMADWTIDHYRHEGSCYHYTCSLTIHKVSMNYSDGTLISAAAESSVNYTRILVTQNNNKHTSPPLPVCFTITGVGIIAAVIVTVISAMYVIRRRCHWSSSYYMHNDYENIPSSSPLKKAAPIPINDDFNNSNNDDVRSCDLGNFLSTPPQNV